VTSTLVTPETYIRAETDRTLYNASQMAGGLNKIISFRNVTPALEEKLNARTKSSFPPSTRYATIFLRGISD